VYSLSPVLSESYVKLGDGLTVFQSPTITPVNVNKALNIAFGSVLNLPGSGPNDTIEIFVKFQTANRPLVLSGRPLSLLATLNFDAGSDFSVKKFVIIGPLLKPLLSIIKTVEVRGFVFFFSIQLEGRTSFFLFLANDETCFCLQTSFIYQETYM